MKFDKYKLGRKWIPYAIGGSVTVIVYMLLSHIGVFVAGVEKVANFISPVFIGLVMAYVMDPMVVFLQENVLTGISKPRMRRNLSIVITIIAMFLFVVILLVALVPQLIDSIITFIGNLDSYAAGLQNLISGIGNGNDGSAIDFSGLISSGTNLLETLTRVLPRNLNNIVGTSVNIGRSIVMLVIDFILAIYFLVDKNKLKNGLKMILMGLMPGNVYERSASFWHRCNDILIKFIACDLLDGLIVGVVNFIFMLIAGMPYNMLISVVVGVTNLAPTFGPVVGGVIGAFVLLMVNPWYALWFLIFTVILQTIDGYVIKPKLFGDQLGVSPVWILVAIIVGSRIFGVTGILLSIPVAAIIDFTFREAFLPWLERRRQV